MTRKPLHIVFMGNPDFAVPTLAKLNESSHVLDGVVTGSDKKRGRGSERSPSPVKEYSKAQGIPVIEADEVGSKALIHKLNKWQPDLFVVVAFKILPPHILAIPGWGSLNLHASLLPRYRGAAPIHHALMNGEKETGCTVFMLDKGMDTGMIINESKTSIGVLETTGDLYNRLKTTGADLMLEVVDQIADGTYSLKTQDERLACGAPKIGPEDAQIDFQKESMTVHNFIRGMSPFPAAWTTHEGKKLKILRSEPAPDVELATGTGELRNGFAYIGCSKGSIIMHEVQQEGKRKIAGSDYLNGFGGKIKI